MVHGYLAGASKPQGSRAGDAELWKIVGPIKPNRKVARNSPETFAMDIKFDIVLDLLFAFYVICLLLLFWKVNPISSSLRV